MPINIYTNFAYSTLDGAIGEADVSLTISSPDVGSFPDPDSDEQFVCILKNNTAGYQNEREIIYVGARSGNDFSSVTRAQEGTSSPSGGWPSGTNIALDVTTVLLSKVRQMAPVIKDDDYTITTGDVNRSFRMNNASSKTFTLPSVGPSEDGYTYYLVKVGAGDMVVAASNSDTIGDGSDTSITCTTQYEQYRFEYCHAATKWMLVTAGGW
jgi:hypothetical protein